MKDLTRHIELLISRYPVLEKSKQDIEKVYSVLEKCYETKHKILIAGNGGSAADAEHIVGELMKGFKLARKPDMGFASKLIEKDEAGTCFGGKSSRGTSSYCIKWPCGIIYGIHE